MHNGYKNKVFAFRLNIFIPRWCLMIAIVTTGEKKRKKERGNYLPTLDSPFKLTVLFKKKFLEKIFNTLEFFFLTH